MSSRKEFIEQCKRQFRQTQANGKVLVRYAKNKKGDKVGVIVACRPSNSNNVYIGFSKCNVASGDKFNKYIGIIKALDEAVVFDTAAHVNVPNSMKEVYNHQLTKVVSYYKDLNLEILP